MRADGWLSRGMRYEERQNGIVEFPSPYLVKIMASSREDLDLCTRYEPREFFRKISWSYDIILRTYYQSGGFDAR